MVSRLAIEGGEPVRRRAFPNWPVFDEREEQGLLEVLHSGQWGELNGSKVRLFQERFAAYQGARYAVCVPNGTSGLELSLRALGIGPGDEVITTAYTFIATASSVLLVGARPVFVDIDPHTYNIDATQIEAAITGRTKAILPVHIAGQPAELDTILAVARRHNLFVLEDACQAWGAEWRGQRVGALGDLGVFSFQSSKNITAGEGGIVVTNSADLNERCWSLHNVGRTRTGPWYYHENIGFNMRLSEWQAAILIAQLERLPEHARRREENARYLAQALASVAGLTPASVDPRVTQHARHAFIVRYNAAAFGGQPRDAFIAAWQAEGITPSTRGYEPLHCMPVIRRALAALEPGGVGGKSAAQTAACPMAEGAAQEAIWLPQNILLGDQSDMDSIVEAAVKIQRSWS